MVVRVFVWVVGWTIFGGPPILFPDGLGADFFLLSLGLGEDELPEFTATGWTTGKFYGSLGDPLLQAVFMTDVAAPFRPDLRKLYFFHTD